ncbi:unnamed protein product [Rhizophagus irregularis]|uniref:Uncharacterized protein n=1 Tax=Rhizophagus irregularis TaxID=588596 RepID=A0A916EE43_9GLOM|nr:unnamed protein product [Rhizophagus irregularis]CAB5186391.1 unnamed protein product [Rhizophagus irregularis]CAB5383948.1 unnamed protein product [Rhizophagus irregularis]
MLWRWRIPEEGNEYDGDTKDHHRRSSFTDSNQRIFPKKVQLIGFTIVRRNYTFNHFRRFKELSLFPNNFHRFQDNIFTRDWLDWNHERKNLRITIESNQVTRTSEV